LYQETISLASNDDRLLFLFYVLANTADRYLVPALNQLSDFFKLSPNVAGNDNTTNQPLYLHICTVGVGVTLLAFGNGAPDVFTSFSSFKNGDGAVGEWIVHTHMMVSMFKFFCCMMWRM
jgi:Ca2+/Na+ antiporter